MTKENMISMINDFKSLYSLDEHCKDSLVILGVDAGESSLLRLPLQSVSSAGGQDVHHINWVVVDTFQHKPGKQSSTCVYNNIQTLPSIRAVQQTSRFIF